MVIRPYGRGFLVLLLFCRLLALFQSRQVFALALHWAWRRLVLRFFASALAWRASGLLWRVSRLGYGHSSGRFRQANWPCSMIAMRS